MGRPDRSTAQVTYPNPSIPADLVKLYREHAAQLPALSAACADGMRSALRGIGVEPPPAPTPSPRTAAATAARSKKRLGGTDVST